MKTLKKIKNLIYSIKNNNIDKIAIKQHDNEIIINKTKQQNNSILLKKYVNQSIDLNKTHNKSSHKINDIKINTSSNKSVNIIESPSKYSTIISPMVGNFYRSPAPNELPFVDLNQTVKPRQTVCIIEAMKLMNEIESEVQGEIVEILVKDGDIVDCGQALMKVKIK